MNYIKTITVSMIASAFLVGCGSSNSSFTDSTTSDTTVTVSGVAIDPELQGAIVFFDVNENGVLDDDELNVITDSIGQYSIDIPSDEIGKPIIVTGGVDIVTKQEFVGSLSTIFTGEESEENITPLTTLVQKYQEAYPTMTIEEIEVELADKLDITTEDLYANIVDDGNEDLLQVSLRVQNVAESVSTSSGSNMADIYEALAIQLSVDSNLTAAIDSLINQELSTSSALSIARAVDLDYEIRDINISELTADGLALTVDNIDRNISDCTSVEQLDYNLSKRSEMLVENPEEIKAEYEDRIIEALGLSDLNETMRDDIILSLENDTLTDINTSSIEDMAQRIEDDDFGFSQTEMDEIETHFNRR